jgi:hypothetical protein
MIKKFLSFNLRTPVLLAILCLIQHVEPDHLEDQQSKYRIAFYLTGTWSLIV